jgi:hypothetical protein
VSPATIEHLLSYFGHDKAIVCVIVVFFYLLLVKVLTQLLKVLTFLRFGREAKVARIQVVFFYCLVFRLGHSAPYIILEQHLNLGQLLLVLLILLYDHLTAKNLNALRPGPGLHQHTI